MIDVDWSRETLISVARDEPRRDARVRWTGYVVLAGYTTEGDLLTRDVVESVEFWHDEIAEHDRRKSYHDPRELDGIAA